MRTRDAWRLIARWLDKPRKARNRCLGATDINRGVGSDDVVFGPRIKGRAAYFFGLCEAIDRLVESRKITDVQAARMIDAFAPMPCLKEPQYGGYKWPTTRAGAKARAAFCRAQAKSG